MVAYQIKVFQKTGNSEYLIKESLISDFEGIDKDKDKDTEIKDISINNIPNKTIIL